MSALCQRLQFEYDCFCKDAPWISLVSWRVEPTYEVLLQISSNPTLQIQQLIDSSSSFLVTSRADLVKLIIFISILTDHNKFWCVQPCVHHLDFLGSHAAMFSGYAMGIRCQFILDRCHAVDIFRFVSHFYTLLLLLQAKPPVFNLPNLSQSVSRDEQFQVFYSLANEPGNWKIQHL